MEQLFLIEVIRPTTKSGFVGKIANKFLTKANSSEEAISKFEAMVREDKRHGGRDSWHPLPKDKLIAEPIEWETTCVML